MNLNEFFSGDDITGLIGATVTGVSPTEVEGSDVEWFSIDFVSPNGTKHTIGFDGDSWFYGNDEWYPTSEEILVVLNSVKMSIDTSVKLGDTESAESKRRLLDEILFRESKVESVLVYLGQIAVSTPETLINKDLLAIIRKVFPDNK